MRDLNAALEYVMDPVTGSELNYHGYDASKEGGFYPYHLTVKPYDMPGQFVVRMRANEFMG